MAAGAERTAGRSLREYARGVAGGLIFSLPLLYTQEVWHAGFDVPPGRLILFIAITFLLLLAYNRYQGLRQEDTAWEIVIDSVEELGLGLVLAAAALWMLGRVGPGETPHEIIGKITIQALTVAIGVSVGTAQLGGEEQAAGAQAQPLGLFDQGVLALCGAVILAANIAPTDEIGILALSASPIQLALSASASLTIAALILYYISFRGSRRVPRAENLLAVGGGAAATYALALAVSAGLLYLYGRTGGLGADRLLHMAVVLGLPATLGASAGRLLLAGE
jgi:putative integral membrane protein (TIGR02587 family)